LFYFFRGTGLAAELASQPASLRCIVAVDSGGDYLPSRLLTDSGILRVRPNQMSLVELRQAMQQLVRQIYELSQTINKQAAAITNLQIRLASTEGQSGQIRMRLIAIEAP